MALSSLTPTSHSTKLTTFVNCVVSPYYMSMYIQSLQRIVGILDINRMLLLWKLLADPHLLCSLRYIHIDGCNYS